MSRIGPWIKTGNKLLAHDDLIDINPAKFDRIGVHLQQVQDQVYIIANGHTFTKEEVLDFMAISSPDPRIPEAGERVSFELPTPENEGASFDG